MSGTSPHRPSRWRSRFSRLLLPPHSRQSAPRDRDHVAQGAHLLRGSIRADALLHDIGDLRARSAVDEDDEAKAVARLVLVVQAIQPVLQRDAAGVAVVALLAIR